MNVVRLVKRSIGRDEIISIFKCFLISVFFVVTKRDYV